MLSLSLLHGSTVQQCCLSRKNKVNKETEYFMSGIVLISFKEISVLRHKFNLPLIT